MGHDINEENFELDRADCGERKPWVEPTVEEHGSLSELIRGFSGPDCDGGGLSACNLAAGDPCSGPAGQCL